ncbi:hypothetical protein MMC13_006234 [Lambiella insularis]|nr:hypothetical protein [Lambiella insularis]
MLSDDLPTVTLPKPHPPTHLGKRNHDAFLSNGNQRYIKRLKTDALAVSHVKVITKTSVSKPFSVAEKPPGGVTHPPADIIVTSRSTSAVQPLANGTIAAHNGSSMPHQRSITTPTTRHGHPTGKVVKKVDKRTLRSQDGGSRSKSELSLYFHNYEELISDQPKEPEFLTPETRILVVDESPNSTNSTNGIASPTQPTHVNSIDVLSPNRPYLSLHTPEIGIHSNAPTAVQKIDFAAISKGALVDGTDPLSDELFHKAHRRAERQEKQLRNIEKERAQHEKVQLERLLEGLKGHDWLRVMGISGITESEKKSFEPKRDWFIREVRYLIEKFRRWKEEEKRKKVEKELSVKADDEGDEEDEADEPSEGDTSSLHDVDALAAMQLQNESISASKTKYKARHAVAPPPAPPPIERPFTSFYTKPYMREAALGKHRRGRTRFAFGQPVPELAERPFKLPAAMLTDDAIRASARSRRRARREGKTD